MDASSEVSGNGNGNGLEALDRRIDQRFVDFKSANEQRFGDLDKANQVALSAQKEALKAASDTTDKALLIERTSTKEKIDTLNEASKRQDAYLNTMIPRGEVTEKIDGVSERVKKMEEFAAGHIASTLAKKESSGSLIGWYAAAVATVVAVSAVISLIVTHAK
jgi:hypothetical protein